jgi:hypothetical protein
VLRADPKRTEQIESTGIDRNALFLLKSKDCGKTKPVQRVRKLPEIVLITRRSLVQIQAPLPMKSRPYSK